MSKDETTATDFDFDGWLSDAALPETTVRVNKYGNLAARLERLQEEHDKVLRDSAGDVRLSSKHTAAYPIAQEIKQVREQMESGWLSIRLRGLTSDELDRVNKAKDGDAKALRSLSIQCVEPALTEAQLREMRDRIGVGQWNALTAAAADVAFDRVVTPDFSASVSASLATGASSKN